MALRHERIVNRKQESEPQSAASRGTDEKPGDTGDISTDVLEQYLKDIRPIPLLSRDEEQKEDLILIRIDTDA